jgi:protein-tyrosine phosphatase
MKKQQKNIPYSKITNYIYLGTNECCQKKHFIEELLKEGIEADISLEEKRIDTPFGVKYYLWLPVKEHSAPTLLQLKIGVETIEQLVKAKKKVYVHCQNGNSRSPTLVAAYLMKKGMSLEETIKFLKSKRSSVHLHPKQRSTLKKFEKLLKK